eukprot:12289424-Prorocentrum_lima.AAC.1
MTQLTSPSSEDERPWGAEALEHLEALVDDSCEICSRSGRASDAEGTPLEKLALFALQALSLSEQWRR